MPVLARQDPHDAPHDAPDAAPEQPPARHRLRSALLGAGLLVVGIVIGLLAPLVAGSTGQSLTAEQLERRAAVAESENFDAGSLVLVGVEADPGDALVWLATRRDGAQTCVVLDTEGQYGTSCASTEGFAEDVDAYVTVRHPQGDGQTVEAGVFRTVGGDYVARIFRHTMTMHTESWLEQFPDDARPFAEQLIDEGFDVYSVQIVGEFRGDYVWTATRIAPSEHCLILSGEDMAVRCEPGPQTRESGLTLVTVTGESEVHEFVLNYTNWGWPYLSIRTLDDVGASRITIECEGCAEEWVTVTPGPR